MFTYRWFVHLQSASLWVLCWMACCSASTCLGEQISIEEGRPRIVYVSSPKAEIRSGPSDEFYPTIRPAQGDALEAHHRTEDGWLAIRPPSGSFSWVPAAKAYLLPGGKVIEIIDKQSVSWIGTDLGTAKHYRWQVPLNVGEQLKVLGEKGMTDANGQDTLWYKIAPPNGEFRWIQEEAVSSQPTYDEPERIVKEAGAALPKQASIASSSTGTAHSAKLDSRAANTVASEATHAGSEQPPRQAPRPPGVQSANYQDDVFADSRVDGLQPIPQSSIVSQPTQSSDPWDGWHAWDIDDDGMRLTFLEKLMGRDGNAPRTDPQAADPFDLTMAQPIHGNRRVPSEPMRSRTRQLPAESITRPFDAMGQSLSQAERPWRDPSKLRQERQQRSALTEGLARTPPSIIQSIRENVDSLRKAIAPSRLTSRDESSAGGGTHDSEWGDLADLDDMEVPPIRPFVGIPGVGLRAPSGKDDVERSLDQETQWYGIGNNRSLAPEERNNSTHRATSTPAFGSPALSGDSVTSGEIEQLKVSLSEMVAQPPSMWNLQRIADRTKHLIEHGANPIERGQARLLLERVQEFETHAQRTAFAAPGVTRSSFSRASSPTTSGFSGNIVTADYQQPASSPPREPAISQIAGKQPYDATGWLVPVHATSSGQPSHALTDDIGRIVAYVTCRAGLDLDSYINQPVGIIGLRGYLPQLQAGHIQAQRVIALR